MRYQRIYEAIHFRPWFISSQGYASVRALFDRIASGTDPKSISFEDFVRVRPEMTLDSNGIATIHIYGVLGRHLSGIEKSCGNTGFEQIEFDIEQAVVQGAKGILFKIDSPGGACVGGDECAQAIANCPLPKVAFTEMACSMGYYLAAGCDVIVSSTTSINGNIGVICPWVDSGKMWELYGLEFQPITNSGADLKSTMHGPSLTEEQRAFVQEDVNALAELFHSHVSQHREVDEEVWRAGWYSGKRALSMGLIDEIGSERDALETLKLAIAGQSED